MNHSSSKKIDENVSQTKTEFVIEDMGLDYMEELSEMEQMAVVRGLKIQTSRGVILPYFSNSISRLKVSGAHWFQ